MSKQLRVAVVAGGPSPEAEVSRSSATGIRAALERAGHTTRRIELDATLPSELVAYGPDVVFPIAHGPVGEDGGLQGALEVLNLPYVGAGVLASSVAAYKPTAKVLFRAACLPVADERLLRRGESTAEAAIAVREQLGPAVVVKPASGGSGLGVTLVDADWTAVQVATALDEALESDAVALCERRHLGKELTCGVLERNGKVIALPATLILPRAAGWYDFESRYAPGGSEHQCPAPLADDVTAEVQAMALAAHRALGVRDMSRADFVLGDDNSLTLLEINTLPGMTETSLFPEAAAVAGYDFPDLCDGLVRQAAERACRSVPLAPKLPK